MQKSSQAFCSRNFSCNHRFKSVSGDPSRRLAKALTFSDNSGVPEN
jgi:hypothetical protein